LLAKEIGRPVEGGQPGGLDVMNAGGMVPVSPAPIKVMTQAGAVNKKKGRQEGTNRPGGLFMQELGNCEIPQQSLR